MNHAVVPWASECYALTPSAKPWRAIPLLLAALLAAFALVGCVTPDGKFDAPATADELELTALDLDSLAVAAEIHGKAGTAKALRDTSKALSKAAEILDAGSGSADAWEAIDFALRELDAVAAANKDGDLAIGVAAAQIVVRRIKAQLEEPTPSATESPPSE